VSIKNKLVTAVTTAGLLAGLFGSAFVPAARAVATATASFEAAAVVASSPAMASNEDYNDTTAKVAYYSAAVYPTFVVAIDFAVNAADNGTYGVEVSGGTVRGCIADITDDGNDDGDTSTGTFGSLVSTSTGCTVTVTSSIAADDLYIQLTLNKLAAGSSATFTVTDPDGDSLTIANAATATGVASTALSTVVSATESAKTLKMNSDATGGTAGATTDVADEVISGVNYFLPAQPLQKATWSGVVSNGYGTAVSSATSLIAEVSNADYTVGCDDVLDGADASSGAAIQQFNSSAAGVWECQVHSDGAKSVGGSFTLTVKTSITGAVVATVSAAFYGELASLTASLVAGDRVPTAKVADANDFFKLVAKDANGKEYGFAELDNLEITAGSGIVAGATSASTLAFAEGASIATKAYYQADNALCPAGSDGKTATIQATKSNATGTSIKSNTLTVTCAATEAEALTVDRIEFSKSNPAPGETFDVYVYMEDADGNLAGKGDFDTADFLLTLTGATVATDYAAVWDGPGTTIDFDETLAAIDGYGRITLGIKAPATVGTTISVNDPATSAIAKVYTTNDAYEGVLTVGPKKLKATADFGPAAAKKKVAFVLESTSGTTKTYYRRANASGVASFTLVVRGTWTVYATFGDEISDTGTMKK
jgi:hypothetical protein